VPSQVTVDTLVNAARSRNESTEEFHWQRGLCEGCQFDARDGRNLGKCGAKRDFASVNDPCGAQTTRPPVSISVCIFLL